MHTHAHVIVICIMQETNKIDKNRYTALDLSPSAAENT